LDAIKVTAPELWGREMRARLVVLIAVVALLAGALLAVVAMRGLTPPSAPATHPPAQSPGRPPLQGTVDFIDTFNTIDASRWGVSDRVATGDWMENDWRPNLAATRPEGLVLSMSRSEQGSASPLSSAEIYSHEAHRYGYYEVRMRAPRGAGAITGAFTYADGGDNIPPQEIDIEILGRDTRSAYLSYHMAGHATEKIFHLPFDAADGFHTYAFEWAPGVIRWYIDDTLAHEAREHVLQGMTKPQRLILNLWGTAMLYRWAGRINPNDAPWRLTMACIARADRYPGRALCPTTR
jgi:beta-glucanase (GH16 family)